MAVIYFFGDSITYGQWDMDRSGWMSRIRDDLDAAQILDPALYFLCYNLGIPGETTRGLVARFEAETKARDDEDEEAVFVFAFGANDLAYFPEKKSFAVPVEEFSSNLSTVIDRAKELASKIFIMNIVPVVEVVQAAPGRSKIRTNKAVQEYNAALALVAKKHGVKLIDVNAAFPKEDYSSLFNEDGVHPNAAGHSLMFNEIRPVLEGLLKV